MKYDLRNRPLFICGYKKSGTSLLLAMLDNHPQLLVYPLETAFFRKFLPIIQDAEKSYKIEVARHMLGIFKINHYNLNGFKDFPLEDLPYVSYGRMCRKLKQILDVNEQHHLGDFLSAVILSFGEEFKLVKLDTRYWVEKTPGNEHFTNLIYTWWPEARCIHIIRDPKDNYAAVERKHPGTFPEDFSRSWNSSVKIGYKNQSKYSKDRYLILRYEDLVQNTEIELESIRNFLCIKDHDSLRKPTHVGKLWGGNSMFGDTFDGISTSPVGRGDKDVNNVDKKVIEIFNKRYKSRLKHKIIGGWNFHAYIHILGWFTKKIKSKLSI